MRLPRPRLTIRRMMVGVAVSAVLLGGGLTLYRWHQARVFCLKRALDCRDEMETADLQVLSHTSMQETRKHLLRQCQAKPNYTEQDFAEMRASIAEEGRLVVQSRRQVAYWADLESKYASLAARPWLTIPPDPPPP